MENQFENLITEQAVWEQFAKKKDRYIGHNLVTQDPIQKTRVVDVTIAVLGNGRSKLVTNGW